MSVSPQDQSATGAPNTSGDSDTPPDTVSRDAHRRLLEETKREREMRRQLEAKLAEREAEDAKRQEQALIDQKKWEQAHGLKAKELEALAAENKALKEARLNGMKYGTFLKALGAPLDPKWQNNVDLDQIKIGEDGQIDEASAKQYADVFKKTYSEIFTRSSGPGLPNDPPRSAGAGLTPEQWRKLPDKEKEKRYDEVQWTFKK